MNPFDSHTKRGFLIASTVGLAGLAFTAAAQDPARYPEREVTMIINYGAGGNTDVAARAIGNAMEGLLKKPVVANNRGGAQGTLGVSSLAKQKADGYTLGVVTFSTIAITPHLMNVDYTVDNFDFIAGVARYRYGVAVRADSPYKTVQDLINAAKKDKGVFFGAPSAPNNIAMFELGRKSGGKFEQVSYKSGAETVSALLGGHVDVIVQNPSDIVPHVKAGKMRLLASASPMRWKELPEVPIHEIDERFTSRMAHAAMLAGGLGQKARRDKATVDRVSAAIILQSFLESPAGRAVA